MSAPGQDAGENLDFQSLVEPSHGSLADVVKAKALAQSCVVYLVFFAATVLLQWLGDAFRGEFGGHPDEGAHYITGLMVRDYVAGFFAEPPMSYAENYYLHYPKVALGHWPPGFYALQAGWTLLFGPSRLSLVLLMAALTALLAFVLYRVIRAEFGPRAGCAAGLLLVALPLMQRYYGLVMAEIPLAVISLWAALRFGRFVESERWQDAAGFGLLASLAILTKGNGLALALVPPLALLFSRRFRLLTRPSLMLPAVIVLALCGPWQFFTLSMVRNGWAEGDTAFGFTSRALVEHFHTLVQAVGIGLVPMAVVGFAVQIVRPWRVGAVSAKWSAAAALLLSVWLFNSLVPASTEPRYMVAALPPLLMFIIAGAAYVARRLPFRWQAAALALALVLIFRLETFAIPKQPHLGYAKVAEALLSQPHFQNSVFMVSSDTNGEGAFISEVAMRERRPGHIVLRGSKMLAKSRWSGGNYQLSYRTTGEVMAYLEQVPVGIVVIDTVRGGNMLEGRLLLDTLESRPDRWEVLSSYRSLPGAASVGEIRVYRLIGHEGRPVGRIAVDMEYMLNRVLER